MIVNMKIDKDFIDAISAEAKKYFDGASGCHDWSHVERVRNLSLKIGRKNGADLSILEVAALLHDIARKDEMCSRGDFCHAEEGARMARQILTKLECDQKFIDDVAHCIETHRFRNEKKPQSIEAKTLYDADKIDALGAVGIGRNFLFAGNAGAKLMYTGREKELAKSGQNLAYTDDDTAVMEYEYKLKFLKDRLLTDAGKKIALDRHTYMEDFFKRFWDEVAGER